MKTLHSSFNTCFQPLGVSLNSSSGLEILKPLPLYLNHLNPMLPPPSGGCCTPFVVETLSEPIKRKTYCVPFVYLLQIYYYTLDQHFCTSSNAKGISSSSWYLFDRVIPFEINIPSYTTHCCFVCCLIK